MDTQSKKYKRHRLETDANDAQPGGKPGSAVTAVHSTEPAAGPGRALTLSQDQAWRQSRLAVLCWRAIALVFMALGVAGVVLPVMPHVPFFLVALWAAGKGWPALEHWLLNHPQFGPQLRNWREHRAISLPVKCVTTLTMVGSAIGVQIFGDAPMWLRIALPCCMAIGLAFVWSRPTR